MLAANCMRFRVYLELHADFSRRSPTIYILTRVYDVRNSWTVRAVLILSRVMSDLAPTGAYFLLRCLNIILTMFFRLAASRNSKFCEEIRKSRSTVRSAGRVLHHNEKLFDPNFLFLISTRIFRLSICLSVCLIVFVITSAAFPSSKQIFLS